MGDSKKQSMNQQYFSPGQTIILRQMFCGKIWEVRPVIIERDTPELRVCYIPPGTVWKTPAENISPAERLKQPWTLTDAQWGYGGMLRLTLPGLKYSVLLLRNADGSLYEWYINLEEPMRRTLLGYDYEDNVLDAVITPDLKSWEWHDTDELEEAVSLGLYTPEQAASFYTEGKKAVEWLRSGKSPFNDWVNWCPDPSWPVPVLPDGWDMV